MGISHCFCLCVLVYYPALNISADPIWNRWSNNVSVFSANSYPPHRRSHLLPFSLTIYGVSQSSVFLCIIDVLKYWNVHQIVIVHEPELLAKTWNFPTAVTKMKGKDVQFLTWDKDDVRIQSWVIDYLNNESNRKAYIIVCCDTDVVQSFLQMIKLTGNFKYGKGILVASPEDPPIFEEGFYMHSQLTFLKPIRLKGNQTTKVGNDPYAIHLATGFELYDVFSPAIPQLNDTAQTPFGKVKFVQWDFFRGISKTDVIKTLTISRLKGKIIQASFIYFPPYNLPAEPQKAGQCVPPSSGVFVDFANIFQEQLLFRWNFSCPKEPIPGTLSKNGTYSGVLALVADKIVSVGFTIMSLNPGRLTVYRLITPVARGGLDITWKKDPKILNAVPNNTHFSVFPTNVWLRIAALSFALLLCVAASLKITTVIAKRRRRKKKAFIYLPITKNALALSFIRKFRLLYWICSGEFLEQALSNTPGAASKILVGTGILWITLLFAHYTSILKSFLMALTPHFPFTDLASLADNQEYHIGTLAISGTLESLLKLQTDEIIKKISVKLISRDDNLFRDLEEGVRKVCEEEKYAFVFDPQPVTYVGKRYLSTCPISIIHTRALEQYTYFGLRSDFPYEKAINKLLIRMKETGVMKRLLDRYFPAHLFPGLEFDPRSLEADATFAFNIIHIIMPIKILATGILLSVASLAAEIIFHKLTKA